MKEAFNAYGIFKVYTNGDVEGRTISQLGIYKGYVDEIALHLSESAIYDLTFDRVEPITIDNAPTNTNVVVRMDIQDLFNVPKDDLVSYMKEAFKDRPVNIKKSIHHGCFIIESKNKNEIIKNRALSKLTEEERKILGF